MTRSGDRAARGILDTSAVSAMRSISDASALPAEPLPFDRASAGAFGQVAASLRRSGRKPAARAYDVLIAATALAHRLPVYTCHPADFQKIDGLEVVPVRVPEDPAT